MQTTQDSLQLELVLPCYNEAESIAHLLERTIQAALQAQSTPQTFQIVVVQNGSTDASAEVLEQLQNGPLGKWFRVVTLTKNQGYGFGIFSGLSSTRAPIVAWSHADLQCDPIDVFKGYKLLLEAGPEKTLVKGTRFGRQMKDRMVSSVFRIFARMILGLSVNELNAQPKVFSRQLLSQLKDPPFTFAFDLYVLYQAKKQNLKILELPVLFPPRIHGASKWASHFASRYKTILGMIRYMVVLAKREGRI